MYFDHDCLIHKSCLILYLKEFMNFYQFQYFKIPIELFFLWFIMFSISNFIFLAVFSSIFSIFDRSLLHFGSPNSTRSFGNWALHDW